MKNKIGVILILALFLSFFTIRSSQNVQQVMAEHFADIEVEQLELQQLELEIKQIVEGTDKKIHFYFSESDRFLSFPEKDEFIVKRYLQKADLIMETAGSAYYLISD